MSARVKATGFAEMDAVFQKAVELLEDEDTFRDIAHRALRPVAEEMYSRVQKRSGRTADDIRIGDEPSGPSIIRASVGFGHNRGGRGRIATFLEYGTPFMQAHPFIRPSYDAVGGPAGLGKAVGEEVAALLEGLA